MTFPSRKIISAFAKAKQEIQQTDEGITSGAGTDSGVGLSFEELRSQDTSKNNISAQLLSTYIDKGERDKIEFETSKAKKEIEKLNKEQVIQKDKVLTKVAEKGGTEKALTVMDNATKLRQLEEKDIFTAYSRYANDFISSKGINFGKPGMALAGIIAHGVNDLFSDTRIGLNKVEQQQYDDINAQQRKDLQPALEDLKFEYQEEMKKANQRLQKESELFRKSPDYIKWQVGQKDNLRKDLGADSPSESAEMGLARRTAIKYEELLTQIDDYNSGTAGFWDGFGSQKKEVLSIGLYGLGDSLTIASVKDKADRIEKDKISNSKNINYRPKESLSENEQSLLEVEGHTQQLAAKNLFEDKLSYGWGVGVATSAVFMEATLLTGGLAGAAEEGIANAIVKDAAKTTLKQAWKEGGTKLLLSNLGAKAVGGVANVGITSVLSPGTYTMAAKARTGNMEFITDENGKQKLLVGEERYNHYKKGFDKRADLIKYDIAQLEKKTKRTEQEEVQLEGLKDGLQNITDEFDTLYKPNTWGESLWYGFSENVKENFSEKYVGDALPGLTNNMLMRRLAKTNIGGKIAKGITSTAEDFAQSGVGKVISAPIKGYNYSRNVVNNLSLGKLSGNAIAHTGRASLIHSLPGEVAEEIWNQFMPTYKQDYAEQLETLKDTSFYRDTIAQTLIQGVAFGGIGMVGRGRNYMNDKARLREMYKALDASITDDDVANNILMNTGGTIYSPLDYDHKIMTLRREDTADSHIKANRLEQNKFTNLAAMAIRTGTIENFKKNLEAIQNKSDVTQQTKQNIALATGRIDALVEVYNKHSEKDNFATIFNLSERKLANDQTVKLIDEELLKQKEGAKEDIDAFIERKGLTIDYDVDTLLTKDNFETPEQEQEYTDFIQALNQEKLTRVNLFGGLLMEKAGFQMDNSELNKEINDQTSPEYEERIETKKGIEKVYEKTLKDYQNDILTSENSVFNYNNELQETPELVDEAMERVKKQYKGRVSDSFFEEVADKRKIVLELKQLKNKENLETANLQSLLVRRKTKDYTIDLEEDEGSPIIPPSATVTVVDDIAEGAHQNFVQVSIDSLTDVFPLPAQLPTPAVNTPSTSKRTFINSTQEKLVQIREQNRKDFKETSQNSDLTDEDKNERYQYLRKKWDIDMENLRKDNPEFGLADAQTYLEDLQDTVKRNEEFLAETEAELKTFGKIKRTLQKSIYKEVQNDVEHYKKRLKESKEEEVKAQKQVNDIKGSRRILEGKYEDYLNLNSQGVEERKNQAIDDIRLIHGPYGDFYAPTSHDANGKNNYAEYMKPFNKGESLESKTKEEAIEKVTAFYNKRIAEIEGKGTQTPTISSPIAPIQSDIIIVDDSEFDLSIDTKGTYSPEQLAAVKAFTQESVDRIEERLGRKPTFREFAEQTYKYAVDKKALMKLFPHMIQGWKENGYELGDYMAVYEDLFNPYEKAVVDYVKNLQNIFEDVISVEDKSAYAEFEEETEKVEAQIAKNNVTTIGYDEENMAIVQTAESEEELRKNISITPRIGYSAMSSTKVNDAGVIETVTEGTELAHKEGDLIDPRDLLNPNLFPTGTKVSIEIADPSLWSKIVATNGRDADGNTLFTTFDKWVAERKKTNPDFTNTQEFRDKVPMFYTDSKGKRLGYVQEVDKFNAYTVKNPAGSSKNPEKAGQDSVWSNHIQKGIDNARALRDSINNGLREVTLNRSADGPFIKIPQPQPKITLRESNPQVVLIVQRGTDLHTTFDGKFEGKIVDRQSFRAGPGGTNGHTWMVSQVGTTRNDKGELVPQYRAYPIQRKATDDQIETARWAVAAYMTLEGRTETIKGTEFEMTKEQAEKIQADINKNMGFNIESHLELVSFIKSFFQTPLQGDRIESYKKVLFDRENYPDVKQHTNLKLLGNNKIKVVSIVDGKVISTNKSYEDYLKDTLVTNIKSVNVGTEEKPVYATAIQPTFTISYTPIAVNSGTQQVENQQTENVELAKEIVAEPLNIAKHEELLNNLGISLDEFEENDDMIEDTSKLANLFKTVGNLNILQEKAIRQFIVHNIGEKVSLEYKSNVSKVKLKEDIKKELDPILVALETQLKSLLTELNNSNSTDPKVVLLKEAYTTTLKNIADIKANFTPLFEKSFADIQKQTQLVEKEKETDSTNTDEETQNVKDYNKESIEESGKAKASYRLRRFLHKINKYDAKGIAQTTYLGLPSYMSFNDVYNELSKVLSMGSEVESNYDKFIEKLKLKEKDSPFITDVLNKLEGADQQIKNEFVYNFVRHTLSSKFAMYENGPNGVVLKMYNTNANEASRIVNNKWKNDNMVSGLYKKDGTVNEAFADNMIEEFNSWDKDYTNVSQKDLRNWLGKLGFTFQDAAWSQIYEKGIFNAQRDVPFKDLYNVNAGGLFIPIVEFLTKAKNDPIGMKFDVNTNVFSNLGGVTKALSAIETKYNPNLIALSFRDTGKNISTLVPTKYITDMVQNLKRSAVDESDTLIDDLQSLSFSEDSIILDLLKNVPAFKGMFQVDHIALTAIKEKGDSPSKAGLTDLSDTDFDMNSLTGFQDRKVDKLPSGTKIDGITMRMAHMLSPTMSDKSTGLYMQTAVFDFMADKSLLFKVEEDGSISGFKIQLKEMLFERLVLPELKRIVKFHREVGATNIKNYDNGAQLFHLLPIMNTLKAEDGVRIIEKLASPTLNYSLEEAIEEFQETFQNAIEDVVQQEVEFKRNSWAPYTETKGNKTTSKMFDKNYFTEAGRDPSIDYDLAINDFVLNNLLFNSEMFKVFAGDIASYSQDKLFTEVRYNKETNKEEKTKINAWDFSKDETYISINKQIGTNLGKRLALLIAPGNKIADSKNEEYNQIFLSDSIDITENAEYLIKNYYGKEALTKATPLLEKHAIAAKIVDRYEQGIVDITPQLYVQAKKDMKETRDSLSKEFPDLSAYFDIESTDAQEYSTAAEHVSILYRMGRLSDKEFKIINDKLAKGEDLTKEELNVVFQPIKPVHTGSYINKDQDVNRIVYIKSSAFPLLPQLTAGTRLEGLRNKMEELEKNTGRFTRASFQTANKVGATVKAINPFDVNSLSDIKEYNPNDTGSSVMVLKRDNFRIQQDVPFKSDKAQDDKVSMGTQFFKLLFGDGMVEEYKEEERDKYATFPLDGKMLTGKELYKHYNEAFKDIVDSKKTELFSELGLDEKGKVIDQNQFMVKLQDLLIKEATSRGYSVKSLAGLKLEQLQAKAGVYYEFKTPLWLSSDSNRYESLLNAIITNRVMKHKMPGNSFVAGSEAGFSFKENLEGVDKSRIIYLNGWNGKELQGVHTEDVDGRPVFKKAQVFIPSKFKGPDKKLIDLFEDFNGKEGKYIVKRENGTLGLKEGMIDPALFNNFSFRTPTSSHVSGSTIEIAGILPPEVGDLMIVPKNFTKQKGLDYDIDKESAYQLNHITTEDGKIQVLTKDYADAKIKELKDKIEKANLQNATASAKSNFAQELFRSFVQGTGTLIDEESLETLLLPQLSIAEKLSKVETEMKRKLAENEFIKTHLAVFNNPDVNVQNKINKVLSIKFAGEQADLIEELTAEGVKNAAIAKHRENSPNLSLKQASEIYQKSLMNFTMLTSSYQKMKMDLGSIGKTAIGVYATYTTFNGLLQQNISGKDVFIMDENGDPKVTTIGDFVSTGTLGVQKTLTPTTNNAAWTKRHQRSTAEVFAEKENTATDNEKEQILGRVGVNEDTINVDAYLSLLGFDKDELGNSISYMLLSQPAIRNFNSQKKASKGILGEFLKQEELIAETVSRLSEGTITYKQVGEGTNLKYHFVDVTTGQIAVPDGKVLTGANLLAGVKYSGENINTQLHTFMTYVQIEKEARALSTVQKTINANTLGKSMIESQLKFEALKTLPDNGTIKGVENLIGEFTKVQGERQDGEWMGEYYVTPTTPQGQIVINGLRLGNTMYQDFFPYQEQSIVDTVKEILAIQGKGDVSDAVIIENFEEIVESIKKYIYSRQGNNVFEMDPRAKRFELFKDTDTNTSLSTYMKNLVGAKIPGFSKGIRVLSQNPLVRSFTYESSLGETDFSVIKYNNAATDNLDEEELYNSIPELVLMDTPLPPKNGKPYSTKMLAQDLVSYSFLQGGVQKATEFVKYVPVEYLETVGTYETQKEFVNGEVVEKEVFVQANKKLQGFNSKKNTSIDIFGVALGRNAEGPSIFTKQYFQHNPSKAPKVPYKERNKEVNGLFKYVDNSGKSPSFVSIKNKKGDTQAYSLFENVGNGMYQKIDTLGNKGVNEYEYRNNNVAAMNSTTINNTPKIVDNQVKESNGVPFNIVEGITTVKELAQNIADAILSPEQVHLSEAAKWLLPIIKNGSQKVIIDKTLAAAGRASRKTLDISINPEHTTEVSSDKTALVFVHELIHTVSAQEVSNYYQADGVTLRTDIPIPSHVQKLDTVFKKFVALHKGEIQDLQNKRNSSDASLGAGYTQREKELIYAGINIREFITVSMTSPTFQQEMSKISTAGNSNLWEDLKAAFMDIIEAIYPDLKDNTLAKDAIVASMNFINEESKGRRVVTENIIPADVHLILQQEEAKKLMYGNPTDTNLNNPINDRVDENSEDISISTIEKNDTFVKEDKSACEGGLAI